MCHCRHVLTGICPRVIASPLWPHSCRSAWIGTPSASLIGNTFMCDWNTVICSVATRVMSQTNAM